MFVLNADNQFFQLHSDEDIHKMYFVINTPDLVKKVGVYCQSMIKSEKDFLKLSLMDGLN
jgi:hypothetical protein